MGRRVGERKRRREGEEKKREAERSGRGEKIIEVKRGGRGEKREKREEK